MYFFLSYVFNYLFNVSKKTNIKNWIYLFLNYLESEMYGKTKLKFIRDKSSLFHKKHTIV